MDDQGYTVSDLQHIRAELREGWDKMIRDREIRIMEEIGPDVYFHVLRSSDPAPASG